MLHNRLQSALPAHDFNVRYFSAMAVAIGDVNKQR